MASSGQFADAAAGLGKTVNLSSTFGGADIGNYVVTEQSQALANITGGVAPVPAALPQQVQNTVSQVQTSLLPPQASAQPQVLSLSTTLVVQQLADIRSTGNNDSTASTASTGNITSTSSTGSANEQEATGLPLINTVTAFGAPVPTLKIQNGGMQLPLVATSSKE